MKIKIKTNTIFLLVLVLVALLSVFIAFVIWCGYMYESDKEHQMYAQDLLMLCLLFVAIFLGAVVITVTTYISNKYYDEMFNDKENDVKNCK